MELGITRRKFTVLRQQFSLIYRVPIWYFELLCSCWNLSQAVLHALCQAPGRLQQMPQRYPDPSLQPRMLRAPAGPSLRRATDQARAERPWPRATAQCRADVPSRTEQRPRALLAERREDSGVPQRFRPASPHARWQILSPRRQSPSQQRRVRFARSSRVFPQSGFCVWKVEFLLLLSKLRTWPYLPIEQTGGLVLLRELCWIKTCCFMLITIRICKGLHL